MKKVLPFTKIIATLGPATSTKERIFELASAGANLFRLNFSHGDKKMHEMNVKHIRAVEKKLGIPLGIICDMQGPKLRVGCFKNGSVTLENGQKFRLDMEKAFGDETRVTLPHKEIFAALKKGTYLLLNDGLIRLQVTSFGKDFAETTVISGGVLSDHKGVNVPGVTLPISALTSKDLKDLRSAIDLKTDWIALSFVQRPEDLIQARRIIKNNAAIITKIEKPAALNNLEKVVDLSDAVMVARGDLGVECPIEDLPSLQKHIVQICRSKGKPVIIATQMLESMIHNPTPTRAEVSDVATAVYDGVDCVMLSGETAVGEYPIMAVSMMRKIILHTEADPVYKKSMDVISLPPDHLIASAITSTIPTMSKVLNKLTCVVTYSLSGSTTLRVARARTGTSILNLTCDDRVIHRLTLAWGVYSIKTRMIKELNDVTPIACKAVLKNEMGEKGDEIIITAGMPLAEKGNTNVLHVAVI
ncbi:MAG: pyruvate kinase [Alphaproteobacteria bacterium]|nr:pyruvate kinase [Alphaproteobacteria bacterium]